MHAEADNGTMHLLIERIYSIYYYTISHVMYTDTHLLVKFLYFILYVLGQIGP